MIRGCNSDNINKLNAKLNFEYEEATWKRPPAMALVLDHIYGVQTSDRRHTVIYIHFNQEKPVVEDRSQLHSTIMNTSGLDKSGKKTDKQTILYDQTHENCQKYLVYFTSRFGILYSTFTNKQAFYQGHSLKISTI